MRKLKINEIEGVSGGLITFPGYGIIVAVVAAIVSSSSSSDSNSDTSEADSSD